MITSTSSSQVKTVVSLQKKAKTRKETKQFVVEGMKMVSEVPQDRLVKVYFSNRFPKLDCWLILKLQSVPARGLVMSVGQKCST